MATKPGASFTIATNANYSSGPRSGSPTKITPPDIPNGLIPGDAAAVEHINYMEAINGDWSVWLLAGTATAGLVPSLVERDSNGEAALASLVVGGVASSRQPFSVTVNSGQSLLAPAASFDGGTLVTASRFDCDHGGPALVGANAGAGAGGYFSSSTGNAVEGSGDVGGQFTGGNDAAVRAVRQPAGGPAVSAEQNGGGSPARGVLYLEPTGDPTAALDGDVWKDSGTTGFGRGQLKFHDDDGAEGGGAGGALAVWASPGGRGFQYEESLGDTSEDASVLTTKVGLTLDNSGSPGHPDGDYIVEFWADIRLGPSATANDADYRNNTRAWVEFHGPSGLIGSAVEIDFTIAGQQKPVGTFYKYTLSGGPANFSIKFKSVQGGGEDVIMGNAKIVARGTYD